MNTEESGDSGIFNDLAAIRERLRRDKALRDLIRLREPSDNEKLLAAIFAGSTSIARSEFAVTPDQLSEIRNKVNTIRSWVIDNGEFVKGESDFESDHWFKEDQQFSATADIDDGHDYSLGKQKLTLVANQSDMQLLIEFGFSGEFDFLIDFIDEATHKISEEYRSSELPLEDMTDVECKIISHYLNKYIEQVIQKT